MKKKCFVISPIGADDSAIRKHADNVFKTIIRPALDEHDVEAIRADHMSEPGKITDQMLQAILEYDICVAVLTGHNPNVFYELAVAQAAARPVILMIENGQTIPFDVKDYRTISYDLDPENIFDRVWVKEVAKQVAVLLSDDYKPLGLLETWGVISNPTNEHRYWLSRTSKEFGEAPRFEDMVLNSTTTCNLMGIALMSWGKKSSTEAILKTANSGCKIRILIMDENHYALPHLINNKLPGESDNSIKERIQDMYSHFSLLSDKSSNIEVRQIKEGIVHFQIIISDSEALCLQYLFSRIGSESPLLRYPAASPLYEAIQDEFNTLWELNK